MPESGYAKHYRLPGPSLPLPPAARAVSLPPDDGYQGEEKKAPEMKTITNMTPKYIKPVENKTVCLSTPSVMNTAETTITVAPTDERNQAEERQSLLKNDVTFATDVVDRAKEYSPIVTVCRHLLKPNGSIIGSDVSDVILPLYPTFCSAIPIDDNKEAETAATAAAPALASIDGRRPISHSRIADFVSTKFGHYLHNLGYGRGDRIAVVLPNGPELALCIISISHWASCVPLNATGATSELEADLKHCGANLVIGPYVGLIPKTIHIKMNGNDDEKRLWERDSTFAVPETATGEMTASEFSAFGHVAEAARKAHVPFVGLLPSMTEAGMFELVIPPDYDDDNDDDDGTISSRRGRMTPRERRKAMENKAGVVVLDGDDNDDEAAAISYQNLTQPNTHDDEVLVLFTSGTTGSKKLVPHLLGDMLVATATICVSWDLTVTDINCNLMPLFHVGGIVRQVFSPLLSGGCVICCPSFDPNVFWSLLSKGVFTWYYAAPTMHQIILATGREPVDDDNNITLVERIQPKLRMIANAAGGLLPSLAIELRKTFNNANVLPSYGMTECMPISSPPANYELERPGTSGVAVGPDIAILNTTTGEGLPVMMEGPICVRGSPCFKGYGSATRRKDRRVNHRCRPEDDAAGVNEEETTTATAASSSFLKGGWFNTGDLGYLDNDGYLYITGRSKEVINRGGEIISPLEVEEAIVSHPEVKSCAAFSAKHDILQEIVGIIIVPQSKDRPRIDLRSLHDFFGDALATPKWPQCLVFMDDLPKSHTNKLLRVKLGKRLGLPEFNYGCHHLERTFEATCPRKGTPVHVPIACERVRLDPKAVEDKLYAAIVASMGDGSNSDDKKVAVDTSSIKVIVAPHHQRPTTALVCYLVNFDKIKAVEIAETVLDKYAVPTHYVSVVPPQMSDSLSAIKQGQSLFPSPSTNNNPQIKTTTDDPLLCSIQQILMKLLNLDYHPLADVSFFEMGGSSMLASQLASKIRKIHGVPFSGSEVFHHATPIQMKMVVHERMEMAIMMAANGGGRKGDFSSTTNNTNTTMSTSKSTMSSLGGSSGNKNNFYDQGVRFNSPRKDSQLGTCQSLFYLIPLMIMYPIWEMTKYFLFFTTMMLIDKVSYFKSFINFLIGITIFGLLWSIVAPLIFVAFKWIIIGKYQPGRYPIWSTYYARWWLVDVLRKYIGPGIFNANGTLLNSYYRLLGAKIGRRACISPDCEFAEYDLISLGDDVAIDNGAVIRGFGLDNGCMILGSVTVGNNASVGTKAIVAPNTSVADDAQLGPHSASYEMEKSVDSIHRTYNTQAFPEPHFLMTTTLGNFILFVVNFTSEAPSIALIYVMILTLKDWFQDDEMAPFNDLIAWLCYPGRILFFIGIRVVRRVISPLVYMIMAILVKRVVIGTFQPGTIDTSSQWQLFRHWLATSLFPGYRLRNVVEIIGRHYELVSVMYRLLGAKVGKRVFWPGSQLALTGECFDMLEIGDDVVFGSRSVVYCRTMEGLQKVKLCAGSNVADNCVVLPGVVMGKNAVLGSSGIAPLGWYFPEGSVSVGSEGCEPIRLERGVEQDDNPVSGGGGSVNIAIMADTVSEERMVMVGDESTLTPYGKAVYQRQASYCVWPITMIVFVSIFIITCHVAFNSLFIIVAIQVVGGILFGFPIDDRDYYGNVHPGTTIYTMLVVAYILANAIHVLLWLAVEAFSKWGIIGRRQAGQYNYDSSSYNQRWEIYQIFTQIRRQGGNTNLLHFLHGTPFIVSFFRMLGSHIGTNVCLYPAGVEPYMPEPELVTIGDNCAIDDAALVCHLNTRGNFELTPIVISDNVTLRCRSRVQKGCCVERGAMLLESSLAITGEVIEEDSVWQGTPASAVMYCNSSNEGSSSNESFDGGLIEEWSSDESFNGGLIV